MDHAHQEAKKTGWQMIDCEVVGYVEKGIEITLKAGRREVGSELVMEECKCIVEMIVPQIPVVVRAKQKRPDTKDNRHQHCGMKLRPCAIEI